MRDPKRIPEVLNVVKALWSTAPDLRLGQLIANLCDDPHDTWELSDDELIERAKAKLKNGW